MPRGAHATEGIASPPTEGPVQRYAVPLLLGYAVTAWGMFLGLLPAHRSFAAALAFSPGAMFVRSDSWPLTVLAMTAINGAYYGAVFAAVRGVWRWLRRRRVARATRSAS